jgi:hypothetical protein
MYGPYITIEQCFERAQEMVDVVESTPIINMGLFAQLGFPDTMMSNQMCDKTEEQAV